MLPRAFVDGTGAASLIVRLTGADGHHYARVLRVQPGEKMVLAMENGPWLGVVHAIAGSDVDVKIEAPYVTSEPKAPIVLVQGLAKGDKMDAILQKGTEVGAVEFVIFQSQRAVVRLDGKVEAKLERWRKIVREAAMQSQRDKLPSVVFVKDMAGLKTYIEKSGIQQTLVLDEDERAVGLRIALGQGEAVARRAICVGPEGGWSDEERAQFRLFHQTATVTLGPRILRTETAGVVGLAIALAHFDDMGG